MDAKLAALFLFFWVAVKNARGQSLDKSKYEYYRDKVIQRFVVRYLVRFGYLKSYSATSEDIFLGLKRLQSFGNLDETGHLNGATLKLMTGLRCGLKDSYDHLLQDENRSQRPGLIKNHQTWRLEGSSRSFEWETVIHILTKAFEFWKQKTPLTFKETTNPYVDIVVKFGILDGPGGIAAQSYYSKSSNTSHDIHFDDAEIFRSEHQLLQFAVHEIGHALGLQHSNIRQSVMYPWFPDKDSEIKMHTIDQKRIYDLIGLPGTQQSKLTPSPSSSSNIEPTEETARKKSTESTTADIKATLVSPTIVSDAVPTTKTSIIERPTTTRKALTTEKLTVHRTAVIKTTLVPQSEITKEKNPSEYSVTTILSNAAPTTNSSIIERPTTTRKALTTEKLTVHRSSTETSEQSTSSSLQFIETQQTTQSTKTDLKSTLKLHDANTKQILHSRISTTTSSKHSTQKKRVQTMAEMTKRPTPEQGQNGPVEKTTISQTELSEESTKPKPQTTPAKAQSYVPTKHRQKSTPTQRLQKTTHSQHDRCPKSPVTAIYFNYYADLTVALTVNNKLYFAKENGAIRYGPIRTTNYLPRTRIPDRINAAFHTDKINGRSTTVFFAGPNYYLYQLFSYRSGPHSIHGNRRSDKNPLKLFMPKWIYRIDAVMTWHRNNFTYIFSGRYFWRYDNERKIIHAGYPKIISKKWKGLPNRIEAAYSSHRGKKTFFISGNNYYLFNDHSVEVANGYPQPVNSNFLICRSQNIPPRKETFEARGRMGQSP